MITMRKKFIDEPYKLPRLKNSVYALINLLNKKSRVSKLIVSGYLSEVYYNSM